MTVYLILIGIILLKEIIERLLGRVGYLIICCAAFTLVLGLSSEMMGLNDRELVYNRVFDLCCQTNSLSGVIELAGKRISSGTMFYVITWIITRFTFDYHIYLFIIGLIINISVTYYIGKYSNDPRMSYIIYLALIFPLTFTIVRQCLAMSVLILSADMIHRKKWISAILLTLLASTIHLSMLIFFIIIILGRLKYKKIALIIIPISYLIGLYGGSLLLKVIGFLVTDEVYQSRYILSNGKSMAIATILIRVAIFIFLFIISSINNKWFSKPESINFIKTNRNSSFNKISFRYGDIKLNKPKDEDLIITPDCFLWSSTLSISCMCFMNILGEFQRLGAVFDLFSLISIPRAIGVLKQKEKMIISTFIIVAFIVYFLGFQLDNWNIRNYRFYWC